MERLCGERGTSSLQPGRCDRGCCRIQHALRHRNSEDRQAPLMSSDPSRLIAALSDARIDPDLKTRDRYFLAGLYLRPIRTRVPLLSAQVVPDPSAAAVLVQCAALHQRPEMLLERIAACPGQLDDLTDGHATVLTGELDDL